MADVRLRVISLGAGVQSTTMALMAAHGEIGPMPDCAIFADTGWEPRAVYEHLDWLSSANVLPFPVHRITRGNIRDGIIAKQNATGQRFASVPWFVRGQDGSAGVGRRQCTREYKIEPLATAQRQLLGAAPRQRLPKGCVEVWIGISTDEAARMKPPYRRWQENRWPLIERRMNRWDCLQWLRRHDYPEPPKSACIGCPYHSDAHWREMRDNDPAAWQDAIAIDAIIRAPARGFRGEQFMHRSMVPLAEADLSTAEDRGQLNLFNNECEGMCGV